MLDLRQAEPTLVTFVVVPTLALLDQWFVSLREDVGVPEDSIGLFSGERRDHEWRQVNLVVINTARRMLSDAPKDESLLIVDECHRAASPENARALRGRWRATLGMSATPEREYDDGLESVLVPRLGPIVFEYGYREAVKDEVITPFDLINVAVSFTQPEQELYERYTRRVARIVRKARESAAHQATLRRLLQQRAAVAAGAAMRVPTAVKLVEEHRTARVLVFHERIPAATAIARILEERGISVALYHSRLAASVRRDNLRLYRRGAFRVLITCRALDEGMNVPETRVAVIASSTASLRQRIQRLGRVLRPAPGKRSATVYTIYASEVEHRRLMNESGGKDAARSISWRRVALTTRG